MSDVNWPDDVPTWLTIALSVLTTLAGAKGLQPAWRWLSKRFEADQQQRALERGDALARLNAELREAREENVQLRQELAEERELRMSFASDYAVHKERVEQMSKVMAEDKADCQRAVRRLNTEIRRLNSEIAELRHQQRGSA